MGAVVYNNAIVQGHPIYKCCKSTLNDISNRDYPGTDYFNPDIACLDMDTYETDTCKGLPDKTVDAAIGVGTFAGNRFSDGRLLLVELRLLYKSANNLTKKELEDKVTHTKHLLGSHIRIDTDCIFVFSDKVAPQALRWMESRKHEGGLIKHFRVYSIKEFNQNILSIGSMPYTPLHNPNAIRQELDNLISKSQYQALFKQVRYWENQAIILRHSNIREFDNIKNVLLDKWTEFRSSCIYPSLTGDDETDASNITEDFERIFDAHF